MLRDFIEIIGINTTEDFPILGTLDRYTQFTVEEMLSLPDEKPDMEQITSVMIEAIVANFRTIATPTGLKVIINGELNQKIIYTAAESTQSVHTAHFLKPFCTFIEIPLTIQTGTNALDILQSLGLSLDDVLSSDPKIVIEDLSVKLSDVRNVKKCGILFTWATVNALLAPFLV